MGPEKNNKEKPLLKLLKRMREESCIKFSSLTLEDLPQISGLLMSVWPIYYGKVGCPIYSEEYLRWVLGGPNSSKHIMFGGRTNDELVAYQSLLFRTISYCGKKFNVYLDTHFVISQQLNLNSRLYCLAEHPIFNESSKNYGATCDIVYQFHEERKNLRDVGGRFLKDYFQIENTICSIFNQFVINPNRLGEYFREKNVKEKMIHVRAAHEEDSVEITEVFNRVHKGPHFIRLMTEEELKYHFFGHHLHRTFVIESRGAICAFINLYPLEMIKNDATFTYVIIEFLISGEDNENYIALLLNQAVKFAEEIGARGIVIENATYLNHYAYRQLGLMPTFRKMTMSVISKKNEIDYFGSFRCDVK